MKWTIDTGLDKALAKRAIERAMDAYKARFARYDPSFVWKDDDRGDFAFHARGVSLTGRIVAHDQTIGVDMDVPAVLRVFQYRVMKTIGDEVRLWVGKARRGELG